MAEFAMVLPMLALLTFGTIEVAIWLQQQSSLNAVAFMASRSASVVGGETAKTKGALADYAAGAPSWLARSIEGMKIDRGTASVKLDASADRFTGLISGLTGGEASGFDRLGAAAALPVEYDPKKFDDAKTGPKSRFLYDYRVKKTDEALASTAVRGAKTVIANVKTNVDDVIKKITDWAKAQPTTVTPAPGGTAPKPKPPGGGGTAPKPPGGGGAPPPNPQAALIAELKKVPNIPALQSLKPTGEAYLTRGAVMNNPGDHGAVNAGSIHSLTYVGPGLEAANITTNNEETFNMQHVLKGLQESADNLGKDQTGLEASCTNLKKYLDVARKVPAPQVQAAIKGFEKQATAWTKALTKGVETEYKARATAEQALFVR